MAEKVYQLSSEQIGVIQFNNPWLFVHISIDGEKTSTNEFLPTIEIGVKTFPKIFEDNVIKVWQAQGPEGEAKIENLRQFLLKTWWNPGLETMRKSMYEQYGSPEFKDRTSEELLYDGFGFMGLTVAHIALRLNDKHFWFDDLHLSTRVVDKFLSVNFWEKIKTEAMSLIGTTQLK
jgi:hypothetical protein